MSRAEVLGSLRHASIPVTSGQRLAKSSGLAPVACAAAGRGWWRGGSREMRGVCRRLPLMAPAGESSDFIHLQNFILNAEVSPLPTKNWVLFGIENNLKSSLKICSNKIILILYKTAVQPSHIPPGHVPGGIGEHSTQILHTRVHLSISRQLRHGTSLMPVNR